MSAGVVLKAFNTGTRGSRGNLWARFARQSELARAPIWTVPRKSPCPPCPRVGWSNSQCGTSLLVAVCATLLAASPGFAAGDDDLDRIPQNLPASTENPAGDPNTRLYFQDDLELAALRSNLVVPVPPPPSPRWEERLFFDA